MKDSTKQKAKKQTTSDKKKLEDNLAEAAWCRARLQELKEERMKLGK